MVDKCVDRIICLQAVYGLASEVFTAAQRSHVAEGGSLFATAFVCRREVRHNLRELIRLLNYLLNEILASAQSRNERNQELEAIGFRKSEKKRLRDFAETLLQV